MSSLRETLFESTRSLAVFAEQHLAEARCLEWSTSKKVTDSKGGRTEYAFALDVVREELAGMDFSAIMGVLLDEKWFSLRDSEPGVFNDSSLSLFREIRTLRNRLTHPSHDETLTPEELGLRQALLLRFLREIGADGALVARAQCALDDSVAARSSDRVAAGSQESVDLLTHAQAELLDRAQSMATRLALTEAAVGAAGETSIAADARSEDLAREVERLLAQQAESDQHASASLESASAALEVARSEANAAREQLERVRADYSREEQARFHYQAEIARLDSMIKQTSDSYDARVRSDRRSRIAIATVAGVLALGVWGSSLGGLDGNSPSSRSVAPTAGPVTPEPLAASADEETGSALVRVPGTTGSTLADARTLLAGAGLLIDHIAYTATSTVTPGTVLYQSPGVGQSVKPGASVFLEVATLTVPQSKTTNASNRVPKPSPSPSSGPTPKPGGSGASTLTVVAVPGVVGDGFSSAVSRLGTAGLKTVALDPYGHTVPYSGTSPLVAHSISACSPAPGLRVRRASLVRITLENRPPVAEFEISVLGTGDGQHRVQFDGSQSRDDFGIRSYRWNVRWSGANADDPRAEVNGAGRRWDTKLPTGSHVFCATLTVTDESGTSRDEYWNFEIVGGAVALKWD